MDSKRKTVFLLLFVSSRLLSVDIGSDSAVSRFTAQQLLNDGDRVAGFACLQAGFKLKNSSASVTFDSFFPVKGAIELAGGTLSLSKDLIFNDTSSFDVLGNIAGNNNKIELSSSMNLIPTQECQVQSCGSEACEASYVTQASNSSNVRACGWSYDDTFLAIGLLNETYTLKVYKFTGSSLSLKSYVSFGNKRVYDLSWHPSKNLLAVVVADVTSPAPYLNFLVYEVNATTGALTYKSGLDLSGAVVDGYAVDWHPSGNWIAVASSDSTKEIAVYAVDAAGIITATPVGTYNTDATVSARAICWDSTGNYLAVGLSSSAVNELLVLRFNQGTGALTLASYKNLNVTVLSVAWSKVSPQFLAVGLAIYNASNGLRIYEFDGASTLTQRNATTVSDYVDGLDWHPNSNCLAMVRESDVAGTEFRVFYFNSSTYSLSLITEFNFAAYTQCVSWAPSGGYIAHGCNDNKVYVYSAASCATEAFSDFEFNNVKLFLNSDVTFNGALIKFTGDSTICGQGHCLDLNQTGTFVIDANAGLLLKDITIKGILDNNIYCTDSTSTLLFDNCRFELDSNYDFDTGVLQVLNDFEIVGSGYTFSYKSDQESLIASSARLIVDKNVTFRYSPSISDRDLINLYDDTAEIVLRSATLSSSIAGLRLTKGNLVIEQQSYLACDGTTAPEGISFGDGISADNDLTIQAVGAANVKILSGYVGYNNVGG